MVVFRYIICYYIKYMILSEPLNRGGRNIMGFIERELKTNFEKHMKENIYYLRIIFFICFFIHIFYFIFFLYLNMKILAVYNVLSTLLYGSCFIVTIKKPNDIIFNLSVTEILIQTIVTAVAVGNSWGFYLFNFIVIVFAILRIYRIDNKTINKFSTAFYTIILSMISFYCSYFLSQNTVPLYDGFVDDSKKISMILYVFNSVLVFVCLIIISRVLFKGVDSYIKSSKIASQQINSMISTDPLTGLLNRRSMDYKIHMAVEKFNNKNESFSILLGDIDLFKNINDTYGHSVGDQVLVDISNIIKSQLRAGDSAGRWGGEEFLILLSEADKSTAVSVAERIRRNVEENSIIIEDGSKISHYITIGVATYSKNVTVDALIKEADKKLYIGKNSGRNRVVV